MLPSLQMIGPQGGTRAVMCNAMLAHLAVTKAHIDLPECREAIAAGRLIPDGKILLPSGQSICSKAAIEPVWYLPEIARRFGCTEAMLRQSIFRMTNGMYVSEFKV